ncbi:hypothetical protein [Rhodococcus sp. T2V]
MGFDLVDAALTETGKVQARVRDLPPWVVGGSPSSVDIVNTGS